MDGIIRGSSFTFARKNFTITGNIPYRLVYSTAHVQVYKKTQVTCHALRNFEDNLRIGLMQHEKHTAHERLLTS